MEINHQVHKVALWNVCYNCLYLHKTSFDVFIIGLLVCWSTTWPHRIQLTRWHPTWPEVSSRFFMRLSFFLWRLYLNWLSFGFRLFFSYIHWILCVLFEIFTHNYILLYNIIRGFCLGTEGSEKQGLIGWGNLFPF